MPPPAPSVASFLTSCSARQLSPRTIEAYAWAMAKLPPDPTPDTIEAAVAALTLSPESRWDIWRHWRTYFRWRARRHHIPNPMDDLYPPIHPNTPPPTLTWAQLHRLLVTTTNPTHRAIVTLILDTGLRLGELAGITPDSIRPVPTPTYPDGLALYVTGKTGARAVPISPQVATTIRPYIPWALTRAGIQTAVRRTLRAAGINGGPHLLRHSFALQSYLRGGDQRAVQQFLGHSSPRMTQRYVNLAIAHIIGPHRQASPALALLTSDQPTSTRRTA